MYISAFHIDGFGILANTGCDNLSPGLSIFCGRNEAGKSTCLEFLRTMLTGYPEKKQGNFRRYEPLNGAHPGGSLMLRCGSEPYEIRLSRSPANFGGLRLYTGSGDTLHEDALVRILAGVDREIYRRIFGFSLAELEHWDKKNDESLRNALYGASFGPGLIPPGAASEKLQKRMKDLYREHGAQQPLSASLIELGNVRAKIQEAMTERSEYDRLALTLDELCQKIAGLRSRKKDLEEERRELERRLGQWQNWDQWQNLKNRLEKIPAIPDSFPEDAVTRLATLQAATSTAASAFAAMQARLEQTQARAIAIEVNPVLVASLPELRSLMERKSSYRNACAQIGHLEENLKAANNDLERGLAQLGPGWTCDSIRKTDRSLFAREDIEKQAAALGESRLASQTAATNLDNANNAVESAQAEIRSLEGEIEALPELPAPLSDAQREELRKNMALLEECRRNGPVREKNLEEARRSLARTLEQAQIFSNSQEEGRKSEVLDNLLLHQDEAVALAQEMETRLQAAAEAKEKVQSVVKDAEKLRGKMEAIRAEQRAAGGTTREILDSRRAALRSLRTLIAGMDSEKELKKELDERINQEKISPPLKNWALIIFGLLFLAGASVIFAAHWFWGMQQIEITPEAVIPINIWAAYAALLCGVVLLGAGFSANGPEQKRRKQEFARMLGRSENCSMHLAEMAEQARKLSQTAGTESLDPIELDAMEMLLEREQEQLFHEERARREVEEMKIALEDMQSEIMRLQQEAQAREADVQQCRRRWHGMMQSLNIDNVPSPESIGTVFARIEAARLASENVEAAQKELDALREDLGALESEITAMPAISERMNATEEPVSFEDAIREAFESCREAELVREKRIHLQAALENSRNDLRRCQERQVEAADRYSRAHAAFEDARSNWTASLTKLGLKDDMNPETVREAYKAMQACLEMEDRGNKFRRDIELARSEIATMENPLRRLMEKIGKEPRLDPEGVPDWLATLDSLSAEAESAWRQKEKLETVLDLVDEQKAELGTLNAALECARTQEREFLARGECENAEDFLRFARQRDERRNLKDRQEDLEIMMEHAAQGESLAQFMAGFAKSDRDGIEGRLEAIQDEIALLDEDEKKETGNEAVLAEKVSGLASSSEPAELRQKEEMLLESVRRMANEWSCLAIADSLLKEAKTIFEKERQPEIIKMASAIFADITDGAWAGMNLDLENSRLIILPRHGDPLPPEALSRGAQEQAYLALRLAYIKKHAETAEPLPVIMDEILVNFDPERATRTAEAFAKLADTCAQQIFYFTCQPHTVELLRNVFPQASLYNIENGVIGSAG